ncbi:putative quinol monooxygenase [Streptococcus pseudoporcinus]|uniref:Antibiotic biosynthesis monooxygenase n=1 Tax=Streptococcus pseudoporcinus TaxID=361101 RepID=A0A4U9XI82_9STRE|nr:antibiotic biosynthesis monooxygenase [Streptococcus pseudoporcinus]VTS12669.1 antibiotic biosynthesis monooxygenase [Streptococcus pseudoporcinus]VUC65339.1 antibiotic biosynthesis monooxygenase [Streptococcus pseudoporcinus]VUC96192.1 antibiotic biosynthesis monooxygenase [Streptococcus pseudoporcinus]VUC96588.1 antibiotic biosynthesis monooxygenase [Streptococcus pseudoporcinus]
MNPEKQAPIMRLFELEPIPSTMERFQKMGKENLLQSINHEEGTLVMASCHYDNPEQQVVFEVYKDEASYREHIQSDHFKTFLDYASDGLKSSRVIILQAELLFEKAERKIFENASTLAIHLAKISLAPENAASFKAILNEEMATSIAKESGVLALFCGRALEDLSQWYFFEVYQNQEAYQQHIESAHFKKYVQDSADIVLNKEIVTLNGHILVSQGKAQYLS